MEYEGLQRSPQRRPRDRGREGQRTSLTCIVLYCTKGLVETKLVVVAASDTRGKPVGSLYDEAIFCRTSNTVPKTEN